MPGKNSLFALFIVPVHISCTWQSVMLVHRVVQSRNDPYVGDILKYASVYNTPRQTWSARICGRKCHY